MSKWAEVVLKICAIEYHKYLSFLLSEPNYFCMLNMRHPVLLTATVYFKQVYKLYYEEKRLWYGFIQSLLELSERNFHAFQNRKARISLRKTKKCAFYKLIRLWPKSIENPYYVCL